MTGSITHRGRDICLAVALGSLLAMVYLLSFNGQFRSIDEYAMYARAESLAQGHGLATPQLAFAPLHHAVGPLEPGQSVLAVPLYLLARRAPGVSNIAAVMLFNVFVTAATGALLYLLVREMGYTPLIGALTTLAWGVGTTAWPYARSFFREPLVGLLWLAAAHTCLRWQRTRHVPYALGCLALTGASILVKISAVSAVPVLVAALLWNARLGRVTLNWRTALALGILGGISVTTVSALYTLRYESPLPFAGYLWRYPWRDGLAAAYGLLLSPIKGIVFFSPIVVATVIGWPRFIRKHGPVAFIAIGLAATLLYVYGRAPQWHGGVVVWGPRFVVPLLPFMILPFATALADSRLGARVWVIVWSAMGLVVQFAAGTASWSDAVWQLVPAYVDNRLVGLDAIPWYSWRLLHRSPALVQVTGWGLRQLDLIWLRTLSDGTMAYDLPLVLGLLLLAGLIVAGIGLLLSDRPGMLYRPRLLALLCVLLLAAGSSGLLLRSGRNTNDHGGLARAEAQEMARIISEDPGTPYTVLLVSNDFFVNFFLGLLKGRFVPQWHSPHDAVTIESSMATTAWAERIWLAVDHVHRPLDAEPHLAYNALARDGFFVGGQWVGGYELFQFLPPATLERRAVSRRWEQGLEVRSVAIDAEQIRPGETLRVELELASTVPLPEDYVLFVQLLPYQGAALAAPDGQPQYGAAPTSTWTVGETVVDRRAIRIPPDAPPGVYQLGCGWLDSGGARLAPALDGGPVVEDMILLGTVVVGE